MAYLTIDQRQFLNTLLVEIALGQQPIILGRKWFVIYRVLPDCKNKVLVWPESLPTQYLTWNIQVKVEDFVEKSLSSSKDLAYQTDTE